MGQESSNRFTVPIFSEGFGSNRIRKIITKMSASHIFQEMVVILSLEKKSKGDLEIGSKNILKSCILYKRKCNLSVAEVHWKLPELIEKYF